MMFDRRLLENFNWVFLCLALVLSLLGIANLYSASQGFSANGAPVFIKQVYWLLIGLSVMVGLLIVDYHFLRDKAYFLYGLGLILLLMVMVAGKTTSGAQRWISLGFFNFQPSEIIKVLVIIALAAYFARREYPGGMGFKELIGPGLLVGVPFLLILRQPDLGTALHLAFACLSVVLFLKIRPAVLVAMGVMMTVGLPFAWSSLKAYQKERIVTFLNPEKDPLGAGYHIIQSKIAVGSGQFWGKGFMEGTQSQLRFLPEQHTDFAFSVFAEEWGFAGSFLLLGLFFAFIMAGMHVVRRSQDRFGALLALGLIALIFWQILINISMVTGLMPVVGLPLPFISYGGSSLITTYIAVSLILNVSMRRYLFQES
jgi:rod shape determining protein RodA